MTALLRASHLPPTLAVTAIATALAAQAGRGRGTVWVTLAVLAGQLSVGWSNDLVDAERDRRSGRSDKPLVTGALQEGTLRTAAGVALLACVPLSLASGWRAGLVHLVAVAAAWSYNLRLKSTAASVVPYVVAFGALPAFVTLGLPGHPWPAWWAPVTGALLGAGAHLVNVLPDLEDDLRTGVRGLPHRLGGRRSLLLGAAFLGGATVLAVLAPAGALGAVGIAALVAAVVATIAVVAVTAAGRPRLAWPLALAIAGLCVATLLGRGAALV